MQSSAARLFALVPCAGTGSRSGAALPKQYVRLAGSPMVAWTLAALGRVRRLTAVLVVLAPDDDRFDAVLPGFATPQRWVARCGGATRATSVAAGLDELLARGAAADDWVLVHDAARCLVEPDSVDALIDACLGDEVGGLLAAPVADTLKAAAVADDGAPRAAATLDRRDKWAAQTPQMFRIGLLKRALAAAGDAVTDEASAVEALGLRPKLVAGPAENFKVTLPGDFVLAERLLKWKVGEPEPMTATPPLLQHPALPALPALRIGEGWDTHPLVAGRPLILGGITVPHTHGLLGHSDADALLHAITDALLGAAALGDIGRHFPDTEAQFKGADSAVLLAEAARRVRAAGYEIGNVDATIVAQAPKLSPHIPAMCERIAAVLALPLNTVNVKAKTAEKMGPVGEGRAIETRAVCLLLRAGAPVPAHTPASR